MKAKPILFSTPMVQAILAGRKTQTRRVMKPAFGKKFPIKNLKEFGGGLDGVCYSGKYNDAMSWGYPYAEDGADILIGDEFWQNALCPYGEIGDLLWVREAFCDTWCDETIYRADGGSARDTGYAAEPKWKPSIHMPRWASRLTLEIIDIRVERLQKISRKDVIAEAPPEVVCIGQNTAAHPITCFRALWEDIHGAATWHQNPWVWVVEFKTHLCNVDVLIEKGLQC